MKRLLRRVLRPVFAWLAESKLDGALFVDDATGSMCEIFRCGLGVVYVIGRTPDEIRARGWELIGAADDAEAGVPAWHGD